MTTTGRCRAHGLAGLQDVEGHLVEFVEQVVGELDVGLVHLVDQQHHALLGLANARPRGPSLMYRRMSRTSPSPNRASLRRWTVSYTYRPSRALVVDLTFQTIDLHPEGLGHVVGEQGLAGAGLPLEQQERPLQGQGHVHGVLQGPGGDVSGGAGKRWKSVMGSVSIATGDGGWCAALGLLDLSVVGWRGTSGRVTGPGAPRA